MPEKKVWFDEFELDFARYQLSCKGCSVRLEGLPLQLLMLLIENCQRVVTREEIAEQLWGKGVFLDVEQGINTAIRKIRLALRDNYLEPRYLQTVVGHGYRFMAEIEQEAAPGTKMFTAEELGQAVMAAAGLDPATLKGPSKTEEEN